MQPATDVIVLSSSPKCNALCTPPPPAEDLDSSSRLPARDTSPSPVPSPSELFRLPSRSRFFATPCHNLSRAKDGTVERTVEENSTVTDSGAALLENKQQKPRGRKPEPTVLENVENAPAKPKTTRKNKADGESKQATNKKITGKVAKSGTTESKERGAPKLTDNKPTLKPSGRTSGKGTLEDWEKNGLQLEQATKRRLDWTPTKGTAKSIIELDDEENTEGGQSRLSALLSGYEYAQVSAASKELQTLGDGGPTKRRRIELLDSRILSLKPNLSDGDTVQSSEGEACLSTTLKPAKKTKPRARKLTTITARVTASYSKEYAGSLDSMAGDVIVPSDTPAVEKPSSRGSKRKGDSSSGFKVPRCIVLSPEEAVKSLDEQELVFGTCSQLQRDDSPCLLKDTQTALQESEKELSSASWSRLNQAGHSPTNAISRFRTPKNLWSVAARDAEGSLVDVEIVDLVDTPEAPEFAPVSDHTSEKENERKDVTGCEQECAPPPEEQSSIADESTPDESLSAASAQSGKSPSVAKPKATSTRRMPNYRGFTPAKLARAIKRYGFKAIKNPNKMIEVLEKCWIAQHGPSNPEEGNGTQPSKSAETASTSPAAAKEPQKPEKKPRTTRATSQRKPKKAQQTQPNITAESTKEDNGSSMTMPANKNRPKTMLEIPENTGTVDTIATQSTPKRVSSFIDVEEIQDSEDELTPSPSNLQKRYLDLLREDKQELPISTIPIPSSPSRSPSQTTPQPNTRKEIPDNVPVEEKLPDLGDQITKAVLAQPRLKNSLHTGSRATRLSWHEKILMYDPIYLEDFTSWLNTEGLGLISEDREVSMWFVRQWCERKGICCCCKVKNERKVKKLRAHS